MIETTLVTMFNLMIGGIFVLSFYVITINIRATLKGTRKLLHLHIWLISASYLILCASMAFRQNELTSLFYVRFFAVLLGFVSLWVLVTHQGKRY